MLHLQRRRAMMESASLLLSLKHGFRPRCREAVSRRSLSGASWRRMAVQVDKNDVVFEIGRMAHNADGAAVVRVGNVTVLGTAVHKRIEAFYKGRMPLTVDYRERAVAVGKMAGSLSRRETNFTDVELRTAGLCHRALASALDTKATFDTQVLLTLLSADGELDVDAAGINAASMALRLSQVGFSSVGAVRVCMLDGLPVANPTMRESHDSSVDLLYAGTSTACTLMQVRGNEAGADEIMAMVRVAREHVKSLVSAQDSLANPLGQEDDGLHYCIDESLNEPQVIALGKRLRPSYSVVPTDELLFSIRSVTWEKLQQVVRESSQVSARNRSEMLDRIESDTLQALRGNSELATREVLGRGFSVVLSEAVRDGVASTGIRADGRSSMQRREFDGEVSVLPFVHGSSLVNVGYTQSLCTVAVVSGEMNPPFQGYIAPKVRENLVVSWESPPYATRDAMRPWSAYGRSEVEKSEILKMSIRAVVPASLPFTVRLHADVLADDGSGISAAVSAASLALFDAGVAVSGHVAGVSIGLMSRTVGDDDAASDCRREEKEDQCIEKDSEEDLLIVDPSEIEEKGITSLLHVAGTNKGLTCVGLDTREGRLVEYHTLELAMSKAWQCLMQQIEDLEGVMGDVRGEMRKTESVAVFEIPPEKKVAVIGAKGRVVMSLEAATDTSISINDAVVTISGRDASNVERAKTMVLELVNSQGNASRISASFQVPEEMMGLFIGKQGANVMRIESVTGCKIDISRDSSQAVVWGSSQERVDAALKVIAEEVNSLSKLVGGASVGQEEQGDVRGSISRVFTIGGSLRVRRLVAGRNGANLNALEAKTSTAISIRSDGQVSVQGSSQEAVENAVKMIQEIVASSSSSRSRTLSESAIEWMTGSTYDATVVDVFPDYAWLVVEAWDGDGVNVKKRAMLDKTHVSAEPMSSCDSLLSVGQRIKVRCTQVSSATPIFSMRDVD